MPTETWLCPECGMSEPPNSKAPCAGRHADVQDFYITFGSGHMMDGVPLRDHYVLVVAHTEMEARLKIVASRYGRAWSSIYSQNQYGALMSEFGLTWFETIR